MGISFGLGKILLIIALVWILWTIWSPDYLMDSIGLDEDSVYGFSDIVGPFKIPITLIAISAVLWAGYKSIKGG